MMFLSQQWRLTRLLTVGTLLALAAAPVMAARVALMDNQIRRSAAPIILAEVTAVQKASRPEKDAPGGTIKGYALDLRVQEVLRGKLTAKATRL